MSNAPPTPTSPLHPLAEKWGWLLVLGIALVLLGLIALQDGMAVFLTLLSVEFFGILMVVGAGAHLVHALFMRHWGGFFLEMLIGLLYLAAGVCLVFDPLRGAAVLTLIIGFALVFNGIARIILAVSHRNFPAWPMVALGGVVSVALGGMIVARWPESSLFIIGLFIAIELLFSGVSWIALALAARRMKKLMS
ncbi:MAG: HdeD family acid-resistance protein [Planctomycetes bacterium]|nr:HdeD family acid-resistance protein [Planctomycetota bacterium]